MSSNDNVTLFFGYGNIIMSANIIGGIEVFVVDKSRKCGSNADDVDLDICKRYEIPINNMIDYSHLQVKISAVKAGIIRRFRFKNIIFDFTNYNADSVDIVKDTIQNAKSLYTRFLVC